MVFSDLKTLEVYAIFGFENPRSVYYFRDRKLWQYVLFSGLKALEVYTFFGIEIHASVYYFQDRKPWRSHVRHSLVGGSGEQSPVGKQGAWVGARSPNGGMVGGEAVNLFLGMVPSRGMRKVGLIMHLRLMRIDLFWIQWACCRAFQLVSSTVLAMLALRRYLKSMSALLASASLDQPSPSSRIYAYLPQGIVQNILGYALNSGDEPQRFYAFLPVPLD